MGPLCTSLDTFGEHRLPPLAPGVHVALDCAGAYGFTEAMPRFLSHPTPAEVLWLDGEPHLLSRVDWGPTFPSEPCVF